MPQPTSLGSQPCQACQPCQPNQPSPGCEIRRGFPEERATNCTANSEWLIMLDERQLAGLLRRQNARPLARAVERQVQRQVGRHVGSLWKAHVRLIRVLRTGYPTY